MTGKPELRAALRATRDAIDTSARAARSTRLAEHGAAVLAPRARSGAIVAAYWPIRSEADSRPLARLLAAAGARLCLPVVDGEVMTFRAWHSDRDLVPAGFGALGPAADAPECAPDVVLAPLLACDRRGGRLGWGRGYYDRMLAARDGAAARGAGQRPFVVGVAFACQLVAAVPMDAHDRRLDAIVTEEGWLPC
ncbi:MAG: 5-formyltetrahydrofolate cyclo-ligase [Planctomycetes bacterium]|nr:5-formyltetrahydrofolate cyclo-ligase [Planctomycetota bacterium]